jgi:hypothetical protein
MYILQIHSILGWIFFLPPLRYTRRECHLDLNILARFARVRLIHATVEAIDVEQKQAPGDSPYNRYIYIEINIYICMYTYIYINIYIFLYIYIYMYTEHSHINGACSIKQVKRMTLDKTPKLDG